jgi:hypothetical protein
VSEDLRDPDRAIDYIIANSGKLAAAKANRVWIEEFRKSKKALLMSQSSAGSIAAKEVEAYSHPEYLTLLDGLRDAVELEEKLKWDLTAAQARIEIYRTKSANNRNQDKVMR